MEIQDDLSILRKATGQMVEWDEEKHPRGEAGKFAPKGSGGGGEGAEEKLKPERKVKGGVEDEIDGHEGVWINLPDKKWSVFVRDGETMEEAYSRQVESAAAGDWGKPAQDIARRLKREDARKKRAEEREGKKMAPNGSGRTVAEERIVNDAKKAMRTLGASKEEAEEAVETAVKIIGVTNAEDLISVALGGKPGGFGESEKKPESEEAKREREKFIEEFHQATAEAKKPPEQTEQEMRDLQQFMEFFGEKPKDSTPEPAFDEDDPEIKRLMAEIFEEPKAWDEEEEAVPHTPPPEELEIGDGGEGPELSQAQIDQMFEDLFGGEAPAPPRIEEEEERALESARQRMLEESEKEEKRKRELAEGRKKRAASR